VGKNVDTDTSSHANLTSENKVINEVSLLDTSINNEVGLLPRDTKVVTAHTEFSIENWKGLTEDENKPPKKRSTYLIPDPTIKHTKLTKSKSSVIGILKNGSLIGLKPIVLNKIPCIFQNTCAFDRIIQAFCVACADSSVYFQSINNNLPFFDLIKDIIQNGVNTQTY